MRKRGKKNLHIVFLHLFFLFFFLLPSVLYSFLLFFLALELLLLLLLWLLMAPHHRVIIPLLMQCVSNEWVIN